ncbi:MAG: RNA polymerase sigma factor [Planctomycetes bacterium]|nr:RNA polymerase sigma factor [Planctomycetota bacterium]
MTDASREAIERVFRREYAPTVAVLTRLLGDIDAAEEAVQDAFAAALQHWPKTGIPPSPAAWITTTARHRAIDAHRRAVKGPRFHEQPDAVHAPAAPLNEEASVRDDCLRMIFTCCHPALSADAQVALTLRLVGGLTTGEVARAFFVPEATMAQRLVRAKGKIRDAAIPYRLPVADELPQRLGAVLAVVYLVFNEGHSPSRGAELVRGELCDEALRLAGALAELLPDEPEVIGLRALLLLIDSRRLARVDEAGRPVLLADQDRTLWNARQIATGHDLVRRCLAWNRPGPYQIQAAIQAVHADAPTAARTDWRQILQLYDQLLALAPTPVVAMNRAVAVAELRGPRAALPLLDALPPTGDHRLAAIRAELLRRDGQSEAARAAYDEALARVGNDAERAFLQRRRASL